MKNTNTLLRSLQVLALCTLLLLIVHSESSAQQEAQYTNFMFNKLPLNAGYAGSKDVACVSALYRSQWVGIDGAPVTQTVNFHTPLFNQRVGLGVGIIHDKLGLTGTWRANVAYAYRPKIGKGRLGIGINGSVLVHQYDGHLAVTSTSGDPTVNPEPVTRVSPNFGTGLYYNTNNFYAGLSIPTLLRTEISYGEDGIDRYTYRDRRHLYLMAGGLIPLTEKIQLKPAALFKYVGGSNASDRDIAAPLDMDLNAMLVFLDVFGVGGTWRMGDSVNALAFFQAAEQFRIGFSYDYALTELQDFNNGSFELMAEYCFRSKNKKLLNPRFFF